MNVALRSSASLPSSESRATADTSAAGASTGQTRTRSAPYGRFEAVRAADATAMLDPVSGRPTRDDPLRPDHEDQDDGREHEGVPINAQVVRERLLQTGRQAAEDEAAHDRAHEARHAA